MSEAKASDRLRRLGDSPDPVVIVQDGRAAGVLLAPRVYDELAERNRLLQAVDEGLADVSLPKTPYARNSTILPAKQLTGKAAPLPPSCPACSLSPP